MIRTIVASLALCLALSGCSNDSALSPSVLVGQWSSTGCEAYPAADGSMNYLTRSFTLTETTWHLDLSLFGDAACTVPLFDVAIDGPYSLGDASPTVAGATEGEFGFTRNVWTPRNAQLAELFTASGCGSAPWSVGVAQDVTATGCIGVAHPISECPAEHDLVGFDAQGRLLFGLRNVDLCTTRPSALGPYGLVER